MRQVLNISYNAQVELHSVGEHPEAAVGRWRMELEKPPVKEIVKGARGRVTSMVTPELEALMGGAG